MKKILLFITQCLVVIFSLFLGIIAFIWHGDKKGFHKGTSFLDAKTDLVKKLFHH